MSNNSTNWKQISASEFAWEREALEFLKGIFPTHEPYRAWSNFEFIADNGSVNEVDVFVLTPKGAFLVEIKSHPGKISGDSGTWLWTREVNGELKTSAMDNPMLVTDRKAKKLKGLLGKKFPRDKRLPFLQAIVFLSAEGIENKLSGNARANVYTRETIKEALMRFDSPHAQKVIDRPISKAIARAMDAIGIRESRRQLKVGMFDLIDLLADSEHHQDWYARHSVTSVERRIRIFPCRDKSGDEVKLMERAARRESQILESIMHEGIVQVHDYQQHEQGPALVYEYQPGWTRLDQFLLATATPLPAIEALNAVRALANAMRYAHDKKLYHRGLSPHCIWLANDNLEDTPQLKIGNWQSAELEFEHSTRHLTGLGQTRLLVSEDAGSYTAPEAWRVNSDELDAQYIDVFSLGALAYLLFTGKPPAENDVDLQDKLNDGRGLQVSDVISGASEALQTLIHDATHPEVNLRTETIADFIAGLDLIEEEIYRPDNIITTDPTAARKGDHFEGGITIEKHLGNGATAVAFLVHVQGDDKKDLKVLKLANNPDHNERLEAEGEVLKRVRHQYIVQHFHTLNILGHSALLLSYATKGTLASHLRKEGALQLELLLRLGEDLLNAVSHLEETAIPHRDIKPENLGLFTYGSNQHLMLFDFSLTSEDPTNFRAGTAAYLDPYLSDKSRRRWDQYAERFAAALTLYEMATATLPAWAQSGALPETDDDGSVIVDGSLFDPMVRELLSDFFRKAFARHTKDRHDNAQAMNDAWQQALKPAPLQTPTQTDTKIPLTEAELTTTIGLLQLSANVMNTLGRININTVEEFLARPKNEYSFLTGVGVKTRKELSEAYVTLRNQLIDESNRDTLPEGNSTTDLLSIDQLLRQIAPKPNKSTDKKRQKFIVEMLGKDYIDGSRSRDAVHWPTLEEVRVKAGLDHDNNSSIYKKVLTRWSDIPAITRIRNDINTLLQDHGGIMTVTEIANALLLWRGSLRDTPYREWDAQAVVRAAIETELERQARWTVRRHKTRIIITLNGKTVDKVTDQADNGEALADYAVDLGNIADTLAGESLPASSSTAEAELHAVLPPYRGFTLPAGRLLSLAVSCSQTAALSSRAEIYPRNMPAELALQLARNALLGVKKLTEQEVHQRVHGRYPQAQQLPDRPALTTLMRNLELGFEWVHGNPGAYQIQTPTLGSSTFAGASSTHIPATSLDMSVDKFDTLLMQSLQQRRFLSLTVRSKYSQQVQQQLVNRYQLNAMNFDELVFRHLREYIGTMNNPPKWQVILKADAAAEGSSDRSRLERLIRAVLPAIAEEISNSDQPVLLTQPGLLARYGLISTWLAELRLQMARAQKPLLLLVATDADHNSTYIDNTPVPAGAGSAEHSRVPIAWLAA